MYQIRCFTNIGLANVWLENHPIIEIVDFKSFYTPSDELIILILYKTGR